MNKRTTNRVENASKFISGKRYEIFTTADDSISFTSEILIDNISISIRKPSSNNAYKLTENHFPSFISENISSDITNNFIRRGFL